MRIHTCSSHLATMHAMIDLTSGQIGSTRTEYSRMLKIDLRVRIYADCSCVYNGT